MLITKERLLRYEIDVRWRHYDEGLLKERFKIREKNPDTKERGGVLYGE